MKRIEQQEIEESIMEFIIFQNKRKKIFKLYIKSRDHLITAYRNLRNREVLLKSETY